MFHELTSNFPGPFIWIINSIWPTVQFSGYVPFIEGRIFWWFKELFHPWNGNGVCVLWLSFYPRVLWLSENSLQRKPRGVFNTFVDSGWQQHFGKQMESSHQTFIKLLVSASSGRHCHCIKIPFVLFCQPTNHTHTGPHTNKRIHIEAFPRFCADFKPDWLQVTRFTSLVLKQP